MGSSPTGPTSQLTTLLDQLLPVYDAVERHATIVRAPRDRTWNALWSADLARSRLVRALLALRALPARAAGRGGRSRPHALTLDSILEGGFTRLAERPGEEIVLGLVGKFWRAWGGVRPVPAEAFASFDEPGWGKAAWSFSLSDARPARIRLATETRVYCTDAASRRRFRAYWLVVRPFSGLIRRAALRAVRRAAERPAGDPFGL